MKKVLINAANLHVGGGVQVAASFILELSGMLDRLPACELVVYASTAVDVNLASSGFERRAIDNYSVVNVRGVGALQKDFNARFRGFDLVFTVFGPLYLRSAMPNHVVGFGQPWVIYPDNDVSRRLPLKTRLQLRLKYMVQWLFFRTAERLVVELQHVKDGLVAKGFPAGRIDVVNNCVSAVYFDGTRWAPVSTLNRLDDGVIKLGYLSRDYPHKNLDFLLNVARSLKRLSKMEYRFFVTLNESEWDMRSAEFKKHISNIGALSVAQCPTFYEAMDAVFFPSLLECFSATPLEAMAMRRPLFASDRGFVRDCCGDNALYFDPLDAQQAAKLIDDWFNRTTNEFRADHIDRAYRHVMSLPGSKERASAYIEIIRRQVFA